MLFFKDFDPSDAKIFSVRALRARAGAYGARPTGAGIRALLDSFSRLADGRPAAGSSTQAAAACVVPRRCHEDPHSQHEQIAFPARARSLFWHEQEPPARAASEPRMPRLAVTLGAQTAATPSPHVSGLSRAGSTPLRADAPSVEPAIGSPTTPRATSRSVPGSVDSTVRERA